MEKNKEPMPESVKIREIISDFDKPEIIYNYFGNLQN
jgi:hypothetical protein